MADIQTINPSTGEVTHTFPLMSETDVEEIINHSNKAYSKWKNLSFRDRAVPMLKVADILLNNKEEYAKIMANEMGKPVTAGIAEIEKCAWVCKYYAEKAESYLRDQVIQTDYSKSFVTYQPLGVIFAIMPWNFPFWQVFRFAAPTLMAGNTAILKHAPITTTSALEIEKIMTEAGFPDDVFRSVVVDNNGASKIINHKHIAGVSLTGSQRAGREVGAEAAGALKKVILELGGSDPYLIFKDADLELAAETCAEYRMKNTGQVCIAAKRIIVEEEVYDDFLKLFKEKIASFVMGDPMDKTTNFGPMAREDLRNEVHRQVQASIEQGATLVTGGKIPDQPGFYYPATLLTDVHKGITAFDEEVFGPVACIIKVRNEAEAIQVANDTSYGLGAAVFTKDIARGELIAATMLESGACAVNTGVSSDPRLPFGGIKGSGYGRELAAEGIHSFTNIKTVTIK